METNQPKPITKKPLFWIILAAVLLAIAVAVCLPILSKKKARTAVPADGVAEWLNYHDDYAEMPWDGSKEIAVDAFPEVTFRWTSGSVEAVEGSAARTLFTGMPVWNVYFADVTGDKKPELCASVSFGSGIVDEHIVVYDYANRQSYTLWDRGTFDYHLYTENGALLVGKTLCNSYSSDTSILDTGTLMMHDGVPCCQWHSDGSFAPLNRELHESELLGEWIVEEETDNDGNVLYTLALDLWKEYHFKEDGTVTYNETVPISSDSELAFGHPVDYRYTVHDNYVHIQDGRSCTGYFDAQSQTLRLNYQTTPGKYTYATLKRMGAESADAPQAEAAPPALNIFWNVGYWTALSGSSLEENIWKGLTAFAEQNGLVFETDYDAGHAGEYTTESNVALIRKAIEEQGANVIILSALEGYEAAYRLQFEYPDVQFLALDANDGYSDWVFSSLAPNMLCVSFDAVHEGYLCGYAAVAEGYRNLAFMGFEHWTISRERAAGFAQGAADAAAQLGVDVQVSTEFVDYNLMIDACCDIIEEKFRDGVEVIYVPDSYLYLSAERALRDDRNAAQDRLFMVSDPEYLENDHALCTTLRRADTVTQFALSLLLENGGKWPEAYAGKHLIVGIESDCVELPEGTYYDRELWRFNNFTVDEYHALIQALKNDPSPLRAAEARVSDAPQTVEEILIGTYVCSGAERNGQRIPVPDEYVGMKIDLGDSYDLGYPTQGGEYFHLATVTVGGEEKTGYDWSVDRDDTLVVWNIETWDTMVFQWYPKEYGAETLRMPVPDLHNGTYYLIFTFMFDD